MWGGTDDIFAALSKNLESSGRHTSKIENKVETKNKKDNLDDKDCRATYVDSRRNQQHVKRPSRSNSMVAGPSRRNSGDLCSEDIGAHRRENIDRKHKPQNYRRGNYHHINDSVRMDSEHRTAKKHQNTNRGTKEAYQLSINQDISSEQKGTKESQPSNCGKDKQDESKQNRSGLSANEIPQKTAEHKYHSRRKQDSRRYGDKNHEQNFEFRRQYTRKMTVSYLKELSEKSSVDITFSLEKDYEEFERLLQSRDIQGDIMFLVVAILSKVCNAELVHLKCSVLSGACKPDFLDEMKKYIVVVLPKLKSQENIINFCKNSLIFFNTVTKLFSVSVSDNIKRVLLPMMNMMVEIQEDFKENNVYKNICNEVEILLKEVTKTSEMLNSINTNNSSQTRKDKLLDIYESNFDRLPRDDFRTISHLPTAKEILSCNRGIVYRNIVKGSYRSVEHYLEVQYRLLREDFVGPLRSGIQEYIDSLMEEVGRKKRRINNVRIYPRVKFLNSTVKENKFGFLIDYDLAKQFVKVNWEYSKRFIFGSLLLFTTDNFKSFFLAKVLERDVDMLKEGKLYIEIAPEAKLPGNLLSQEFVMAESEIYFEPYYHVLIALQSIREDNFPMRRYIVDAAKDALLPKYLGGVLRMYKIGKHLMKIGNKPDNLVGWYPTFYEDDDDYYYYNEDYSNWPSAEDLCLDITQYAAFKAALTSEFVAIQGPPGTGKTFLGLKIAEVLLNNLKNDASITDQHTTELFPILVVCYTNHALDQFLEGILKYTKNIVRIGGRSQNEALNEFNLRNQRVKCRFNKGLQFFLTRRTLDELQEMLTKIISLENMLQKKMFDGILFVETFKDIMNTKQYEQLKQCFVEWLMEGSHHYYVPGRNEMLQDFSDCANNIETEDSVQSGNGETVTERINSQVVEEAAATTIDAGEQVNNVDGEVEEEEEEYGDDELSKLRKNEICIDFEPEILLNPSLVSAQQPTLQFKLGDLYNRIQELNNSLINMTDLANDYEDNFFYMADSTLNRYLNEKRELQEMEASYNYLWMRLNEKINFRIVSERQLFNVENVFSLNLNERWALYHWWLQKLFDSYAVRVKQYEDQYRKLYLKHSELRQLEDVQFLRHVKVIGMTTSGAANRRTMIENLNPRIVIVEEAAEVLEAHIVTALTKKCEHVILIGDHKQLRPSTAVYELAKHYHLDVSLFERMLKNGLNCHTLGTQHRMRPEIASLIVPAIYPHLENHLSVYSRPNIKGVMSNLYFITHTHFEDEVTEGQSKMNRYEGDFLIRLCKHFLYQGYSADEITILVTYSGQMMYMRKKKRGEPMLKNVRITVVDNFQGEENKIILLSLVRSNTMARIGFLGTENRVCVALSRARDGLYIIGNMDNLTESSIIWKKIKEQLENMNALGPALTLQCVNHNRTMRVSTVDDFKSSPEGGCTEPCDAHLSCGHKCQRNCHILDSDHSSNENCTQRCERFCTRGIHKCRKRCCDECGDCQISVEYVLDCRHKNSVPCHMDPSEYKCSDMVTVKLPLCGHENDKLCYLDINRVKCRSSCQDRLPCGHSCEWKCHKDRDPDHIKYNCRKPCTKKSINCTENHTCAKLCFEECGMCVVKRLKELPCGHMLNMECSADVDSVKCKKPCTKILPCGHPCTGICSEPCKVCEQKVKKVIPECGHEVEVMCSVEPERSACKAKCERTLKCGHKCTGMCRSLCDDLKCHEMVESCEMPTCCHPVVMVPCCENKKGLLFQCILEQYCKYPCKALLSCSHECTGDCSSCMQGRIHVPCTVRMHKTLICGHTHTLECNENSTYCGKSCLYRCHHSECNNKCGQQCQPCQRRCEWSCVHQTCTKKCFEVCNRSPCNEPCTSLLGCGHLCIGFCGEVCPKLCRVCDKEKLTEIFAGFKKKPNARFVILEDCNHCVESEELEIYLKIENSNDSEDRDKEICLKTCPVCLTPINRTRRYSNEVKMFYQQLVKLRKKVFDDIKGLENLKRQLSSTLQDVSKVQSPAQTLIRELSSDKIEQNKKSVVQAETLSKCFISELLILLSEKYNLLMMIGKFSEVVREAINAKLLIIISIMKLRLKRVGVYEMMDISNEVHRILRLMELVILMNMGTTRDPLSNDNIDYMTVIKEYGFGNVLFSINRYSLRDDDRMKALLFRINEDYDVANRLQISVISNYKVCISQMKCVNLYGVQWFVCGKGHTYIMRIYDDVVLRCECNQNDGGKIEILMHLTYSAQHHHNNHFNVNKKQHHHRSRSSSVVSQGSSKLSGKDTAYANNENWTNQVPDSENRVAGQGFSLRGRYRGGDRGPKLHNNINGIQSLDLEFRLLEAERNASASRGKQNQKGRKGNKSRGRGQRY